MTSLHGKAPTRPAERNLPLRLCEVLEQEYAIIHGHQDRAPTWLIESGQVDATRVIELLRNPSLSALPVAAATVRAKLEAQGISFATERTIDAPLGQSICDALNAALLADEPLYDPQLLPDSSTRQLPACWRDIRQKFAFVPIVNGQGRPPRSRRTRLR